MKRLALLAALVVLFAAPIAAQGPDARVRLYWLQAPESLRIVAHADAASVRLCSPCTNAGVVAPLEVKAVGNQIEEVLVLHRNLEPAQRHEFFVRIDMESSAYTDITLEVFDTLWQLAHRNIGVVLQSCLHRTDRDLRMMNELGARVRLVKGAYQEPAAVAYQQKADVDGAYLRQMRLLLDHGVHPAFATHDEALLREIRDYAAERKVANDRYEFQMLYGIRRDLQASFVADGYRMRVYVPFGQEWFPYFMRRLGERPANVMSVIRALLGEKK